MGVFFQNIFNRDLKQFREGAMTTCSGKAFQESITLRLKLLDLIFSLCCFLASLS